jgi:hypothetical protein
MERALRPLWRAYARETGNWLLWLLPLQHTLITTLEGEVVGFVSTIVRTVLALYVVPSRRREGHAERCLRSASATHVLTGRAHIARKLVERRLATAVVDLPLFHVLRLTRAP